MATYGPQKQWMSVINVSPIDRQIQGNTRDGGTVSVSLYEIPIVFRWPAVGEIWSIERDRLNDSQWNLGARVHNVQLDDEVPITDFETGQMRLDATDVYNREGHRFVLVDESEASLASFTIGDGVARTFVLNHDLGTRDVQVLVYQATAPYSEVTAEVEHTDDNTVTIKTDAAAPAPTAGQYHVAVSIPGAGGSGGEGGAPEVHVGTEPPDPRGDKLIWVDTNETATGGYGEADARLDVLEADSGWIDLPLVSPWIQYDASVNFRAQYRKIRGIVYIRGLVRNTVAFSYAGAGSNLTIATLPVGFRPIGTLMGEGYASDANASELILRLDLQSTDGALKIILAGDWVISGTGNSGTVGWLKLNFVPYPADN